MKKLFFVILIAMPSFVFAQSIEKEIDDFTRHSGMRMIQGARQMIIHNLSQDGTLSAKEAYDYLVTRVDTSTYIVFTPQEHFKLVIYLKDYNILSSTHALFSIMSDFKQAASFGLIQPPEDGLSLKLKNKLKEGKESIIENISEDAGTETAEFASLVVDLLTSTHTAKEMNKLCDEFIDKYKETKYLSFVKTYIKNENVPDISEEHAGFQPRNGVSFGVGAMTLSGEISRYFTNSSSFDISADIFVKRVLIGINAGIGVVSKTRHDLNYRSDLWPKNTEAVMSLVGIDFGYRIDSGKNGLYPFVGFGVSSIYPSEKEKERGVNVSTLQAWSLSYGIYWDITLKNFINNMGKSSQTRIRFKLNNTSMDFHENVHGQSYRLSALFFLSFE